jgi:hypothetical protein
MNEEIEVKRSFIEVMNKQKDKGANNELLVLFYVARFYFLSGHQLSKLLGVEHGVLRHVLRRLIKSNQLRMAKFDNSQTNAYALTRAGVNRVDGVSLGEHKLKKITCRYGDFLFTDGSNYHRHVTNDFLIDLVNGWINFHDVVCDYFITEHEISNKESMYLSNMGCVPDALAVTTDKRLIVIESENTYRSRNWHGPKLYSWLYACADRFEREGCFSDEYPRPIGRFEDVEQVFVCTNELNFRSMFRMVERALEHFEAFKQNISYWIIPDKTWVNPVSTGELLLHDDVKTVERVKKGERLYKQSDEFMLMVLNEVKNNQEIILANLAKKHGVSRSTITRWNLKFNYIYKR